MKDNFFYINTMAVANIDNVYKTVLLIMNNEQRGFMTPDEFNKIAALVQLDILNEYFEDLNQLTRANETSNEYSNRIKSAEEKLATFKITNTLIPEEGNNVFIVPSDMYKLGSVIYNDSVKVERKNRSDVFLLTMVPFTRPSVKYPVYIYDNGSIEILPSSINSGVKCNYIQKPAAPVWGYIYGDDGYTYSAQNTVPFKLDSIEENNIIKRVLIYAGVVVNDPTIIQVASSQVNAETVNKKS